MPELVTIPNALFEYAAFFERPIISLWIDRAQMVQAVFDALIPWGMDVADVEGRNEGKPAEQGFALRLPDHHATFFFGPAKFTFTHTAADWTETDKIIEMIEVALDAILRISGAYVKTQKATIALHMQPKSLGYRDIISRFWPLEVLALHSTAARTGAVILKWEDAAITIDGSGLLKNGVFLRLERDFSPSVKLQEIGNVLRGDEENALSVLHVEVEQV